MTDAELYAVGIVPASFRFLADDPSSSLRIVWRGSGVWAVVETGCCLNHDGEWEVEPMPSNRDDKFLERCRFTLDDAARRALKHRGKTYSAEKKG